MHLSIRAEILLAVAALGTSAATAQTELFFATGVDSTGWALAQSNADGHVLIESPQYPRGLWLHLVHEAGDALAGIRVEYQGRPDSLVAIHCVDPAGEVRETLVWTRPEGDPLSLMLKPSEATGLIAGAAYLDWQIDPSAASLLEPMKETRLIGWETVAAFLRERWQSQTGRVAAQFDTSTSLAVELDHPKVLETLVAYLQQFYQSVRASLGKTIPLRVQVFEGLPTLQEGVILHISLFEDPKLEWVMSRALGYYGYPVPWQDSHIPEKIASLTNLRAGSSYSGGLHSLAGLEYFTALRSLWLPGNEIVDITPLAALNNLQSLVIWQNQLTDIAPLATLTNLQELDLMGNRIADTAPLATLTNLQELNMMDNRIADVAPLATLTNLQELNMRNNRIADVAPLAYLTNLQELTLTDNRIADIASLVYLTNLQSLDLGQNQLIDLSPLAYLTNLRSLYLGDNRLANLSPLAHLTNLRSLDLEDNRIADLSPLAHLTNLAWLDLKNNQIADLSPLIHLANLHSLYLKGNPLSDQARKEQIPALKAQGVTIHY